MSAPRRPPRPQPQVSSRPSAVTAAEWNLAADTAVTPPSRSPVHPHGPRRQAGPPRAQLVVGTVAPREHLPARIGAGSRAPHPRASTRRNIRKNGPSLYATCHSHDWPHLPATCSPAKPQQAAACFKCRRAASPHMQLAAGSLTASSAAGPAPRPAGPALQLRLPTIVHAAGRTAARQPDVPTSGQVGSWRCSLSSADTMSTGVRPCSQGSFQTPAA